jgi:hypothetical protein
MKKKKLNLNIIKYDNDIDKNLNEIEKKNIII